MLKQPKGRREARKEGGGAALKQQRLIENGREASRFTANLITICSRETRRRIPNELLWTAPEGNGMSNTPRQLPSSEPEDLRGPKSKKGMSRPGRGPLRRARPGQVLAQQASWKQTSPIPSLQPSETPAHQHLKLRGSLPFHPQVKHNL